MISLPVGGRAECKSERFFVSNIIVRSAMRAIPTVVYLHVACSEKVVNTSENRVVVDGVPVSFSLEGNGDVNVVLVHGFAAHRHWWDWVVPELRDNFRILRVDLSGHGDSEHRDRYSVETWSEELIAAKLEAFGDAPSLLVGHSLGGRVVIASSRDPRMRARGVLVLDTSFPNPEQPPVQSSWNAAQRLYASREAALGRFRLVPGQPLDPTILRSLAEHSVRAVQGGWSWKHDFRLNPTDLLLPSVLDLGVPLGIAYGEESSVVDAAAAKRVASLAGPRTTVSMIPGAHHHVVLDSPRAVAAIIANAARDCGDSEFV